MLTEEENVDIHALRRRGWSVSAIARHLGRDRKTVRAYLAGARAPGERAPAGPDAFEPYVEYARARLVEDPHLWATALHDELRARLPAQLPVADARAAAQRAQAAL